MSSPATAPATATATAPATATATATAPAVPARGAAATALELLDRSRHSLLEACQSTAVAERYVQAHLAALRAAAALVAARTGPDRQGGPSPSGPRSLWELLPALAPELSEWAGFFELASARAPQRHAAALTTREADDLLRQAETFLDLVCRSLGLPVAHLHGDVLVPTGPTHSQTTTHSQTPRTQTTHTQTTHTQTSPVP